MAHNVSQLNADFVFHKICDLGAVSFSCLAWDLLTKIKKQNGYNRNE